MGILPRAPKVEVFAPTTLFVGRPCTLEVVVEAIDETKVEFIDVRIRGTQGWTIGAGEYTTQQRVTYPDLVARLRGEGTLPAGTSRFKMQFTLPPGTPPTHDLRPAHATVEAKVHVAIPWWPDGRYAFVLPVRVPPPATVTRAPIVCVSSRTAEAPRLEVSLASTRLIAGESVVGSCAVFHMDDTQPRELELQLVPVFELHGSGRVRSHRADGYQLAVTLPAGSAGTAVPFRFQLPEAIVPSFTTVSHALAWQLVVRTGSFFRGKLELAVPLEIVDQSARATTARLVSAPRLADERVTAVFAQFAAARGWRSAPPARSEDPVIERDAGGSVLSVGYAYRGKQGTFLVGRVAGPSLGLGLTVRPASALRHVFWRDIEADIAAWDRAHHVAARSAAQTVPVLRAVAPALQRAVQWSAFVTWDDREVVVERPVDLVEAADLSEVELALAAIATALDAARPIIAPPPGVTVDVAAWRALAQALRGRLTLGELAIDGHTDVLPVELGLVWDGEGRATGVRVAVGDPQAASELLRQHTLSLARPAADALAEPAAERLIAQLVDWPEDVTQLRVADGVASATWSLPGGEAPVVDAARVRALVASLRAVLATLDPGAGPYR